MANNRYMIKKLQTALNTKGIKILYNTTEFYSEQANKTITMHSIKQSKYDENVGRNTNIELFKSSSMIQVVLFLRDMWYNVNGMEIPTSNEVWNKIKNKSVEE